MSGAQLKTWRKSKGLTRESLGTEFGVSKDTVAKWEQGVNPIPKAVERCIVGAVAPQFTLEEFNAIGQLAKKWNVALESAVTLMVREQLAALKATRSSKSSKNAAERNES